MNQTEKCPFFPSCFLVCNFLRIFIFFPALEYGQGQGQRMTSGYILSSYLEKFYPLVNYNAHAKGQ